MKRRLLDYDPTTKTTTWFQKDAEGVIEIVSEQDVSDIVEASKIEKIEGTESGIKRDWMKLGTIPNLLLNQWAAESGIKNIFSKEGVAYCAKKLHERDYAYLKTANGHYIRRGNG